MLRRNRYQVVQPIPYFGLLPIQILSCKTFELSYKDEPRRLFLLDPLLLIPRLTCQAEVRLDTQGTAVVSLGPLLLVPLASRPTEPEAGAFHLGGPSFPHSSRIGSPAPATGDRSREYSYSLISWTHFYSFHVIHEGVPAALRSTRQAESHVRPHKEIAEIGKHRERTYGCFCPFGQHGDPVSAQIAEEPPAF